MEADDLPAHEAIDRFKEQLRTFAVVSGCTLTFPNKNSQPEILWEVYAASSPAGAPLRMRSYSFYPGDVVELTESGDGLLTTSVQIGNYGPPEIRRSYGLRVGAEACVWTCDDNDFDLPVHENSFRVGARAPEILARVVEVLVDWHAARGVALLRREEGAGG